MMKQERFIYSTEISIKIIQANKVTVIQVKMTKNEIITLVALEELRSILDYQVLTTYS